MYQVPLSLFYVGTNYAMVAQRENWSLQERDEIYLVFGFFFFLVYFQTIFRSIDLFVYLGRNSTLSCLR